MNKFSLIIDYVKKNRDKLKKLGKGGQADVFLYNNNGHRYAIRVPKTELSDNEIKILEKIKDLCLKNVIEIYYFDGSITVTPVYDCDMNVWMETKRTDKEWKMFIKDVKNGIDNLMSIGVCHRDLKPRNILVKNNRFYITDFGHSWIVGDIKLDKEIDLCIKNKLDYQHIYGLVSRVKVNNMVKKLSYDKLYSAAKKYPDFKSYFRNENRANNEKQISNNLKKFLLTKSISYFLVEKKDRLSYIDGKQKLPSKNVEETIKKEFI